MNTSINFGPILCTPPHTSKEFIACVEEKTNIECLDRATMLRIFTFLDMRTLLKCSLVSKRWKWMSADRFLWKALFATTDLSHIKTENSFRSISYKYTDISLAFVRTSRFEIAMAACEKSAQHDAVDGASGLRNLCVEACKLKEYETAMLCCTLAKKFHQNIGNQAVAHCIESRVKDSDFLEKATELVHLSVDLIKDDREFGLQALMTIAKKFADLELFKDAIDYTQQAHNLRDEYPCNRERICHNDIHPFGEMGKHFLDLNQYELAINCAKKVCRQHHRHEYLYAAIILKQIQKNNFINESLFAEIERETLPWIFACEGLAFGLLDHHRLDEAKKYAKMRLSVTWFNGKNEFEKKFKEKLNHLEICRSLSEFTIN